MTTLDLAPYQAPLPYPELRGLRPDTAFARELMQGYSGPTSETTTVLQYAYHSLCCRKKHPRLGEVMRGIYHVETLHQQLLGECVLALGIDPRYVLSVQDKTVCWQGALVDYQETPARMLLSDLAGEKEAAQFYEEYAEKAQQPQLRQLLSRLAEDEKLHVRMLTELYAQTFRQGR